jgi:hypothetical protein
MQCSIKSMLTTAAAAEIQHAEAWPAAHVATTSQSDIKKSILYYCICL